jgi:superfamily I DNA/RNA helicase
VRTVLDYQDQGIRVFLVGGGTELAGFARAAQKLMDGEKTDHQDLACFDSWQEVLEYVADDEQGHELKLNVGLVDDFTVPTILQALEGISRENEAEVIVSTAHKSKGREWNAVRLGSDFPDDARDDELRLLYVSLTRARFALDCSAVPFNFQEALV